VEKGIRIYTVKGGWQLDNTIQSKVMAMVFSMAAEIERELISKRTKEALQSIRLSGVQLGRPKGPGKSKLDAFRPEIEALLGNGSSQKFIAGCYKVTEPTLCNWMKKNKIKKYSAALATKPCNQPDLRQVKSFFRQNTTEENRQNNYKVHTKLPLIKFLTLSYFI